MNNLLTLTMETIVRLNNFQDDQVFNNAYHTQFSADEWLKQIVPIISELYQEDDPINLDRGDTIESIEIVDGIVIINTTKETFGTINHAYQYKIPAEILTADDPVAYAVCISMMK